MMRAAIGSLLFLAAPALAAAQTGTEQGRGAIRADMMLHRISVLAHDSMAGRDTPSPELEQAASWIAAELERFGVRGGAEGGGFVQRFPLLWRRLAATESTLQIEGEAALSFGTDVVWLGGGLPSGQVRGRSLVIQPGTDGIPSPAEIHGTIIVLRARTSLQQTLLPQLQVVINELVRHIPAAIIVAADVADTAWNRYYAQQGRVALAAPWLDTEVAPILLVRSAPFASVSNGVDIRVTLASEVVERADAPNVIGVIDGTDPQLRHEHVVFVAHIDHVGTAGRSGTCPAHGDNLICNGADDNASGTAALMSIAETVAAERPGHRRSILFLFAGGEERGLWGSDWFAENPSVPFGDMVAVLNADNLARNEPGSVYAIGMDHSSLGATVRRTHAQRPELGFTGLLDLPPGQEGFYFRSDHYSFSRRGVPALFFSSGIHGDYHQPTDEIARVDADKAARIATLMMHVGLDIANADSRPEWDSGIRARIVNRDRQ